MASDTFDNTHTGNFAFACGTNYRIIWSSKAYSHVHIPHDIWTPDSLQNPYQSIVVIFGIDFNSVRLSDCEEWWLVVSGRQGALDASTKSPRFNSASWTLGQGGGTPYKSDIPILEINMIGDVPDPPEPFHAHPRVWCQISDLDSNYKYSNFSSAFYFQPQGLIISFCKRHGGNEMTSSRFGTSYRKAFNFSSRQSVTSCTVIKQTNSSPFVGSRHLIILCIYGVFGTT